MHILMVLLCIFNNGEDDHPYHELCSNLQEGRLILEGKYNITDNKTCTENNERYPVEGSCDKYIECVNGKPIARLCPDGLRFNRNEKLSNDPCQYPADVKCPPGSSLQPARRIKSDCPRQFGYYKLEDAYNCSSYRICEDGIAYNYKCLDGLAFRADTSRCDWPHKVKECDAEGYADFKCPQKSDREDIFEDEMYRSNTDCQVYYICKNGRPRRMHCGEHLAFNWHSQLCISATEVRECPSELKYLAAQFQKSKKDYDKFQEDYFRRYEKNRRISLSFTNLVTTPAANIINVDE